jgi:methylmalonyl-CoA mutase cobalamin-binding domain/chain
MNKISEEYINALADLNEDVVINLTEARLRAGDRAATILKDVSKAMSIVGKRFEETRYFVADLIMAGEILKKVMQMIKSKLKENVNQRAQGKIVIGTVEGDIHDIGKNIVISIFEANGFEIIDLGVDVAPENFLIAIKDHKPQILGMSALLTPAFEAMKMTVEAIKSEGLRDKIKIIIGGGTVDENVKNYVGADAYCLDPFYAVKLAKKWVKMTR